jgi:hypothetical protein
LFTEHEGTVFFDATIIKIIHPFCFCNCGTNFLRRVGMLKDSQHTLWLMNFKQIILLLVNTTHARRHTGLYCKFGWVINRKVVRNIFAEFAAVICWKARQNTKTFTITRILPFTNIGIFFFVWRKCRSCLQKFSRGRQYEYTKVLALYFVVIYVLGTKHKRKWVNKREVLFTCLRNCTTDLDEIQYCGTISIYKNVKKVKLSL